MAKESRNDKRVVRHARIRKTSAEILETPQTVCF